MDEFKQAQRNTWAAGDFPSIGALIKDVGERVVERAEVDSSMNVLDVACGAGNAAIPAAKAGAKVVGLDLVPELLEAGREQAREAGVAVEFVEGDAEELPFDDGRFQRVLSTFGHMFAPRHKRTAEEMTRVGADGATIVTATWLADGSVGRMFKTTAGYMPPPPDYVESPILWGEEDHVREMFDGASDFAFERLDNVIEWESLESFAEFFIARFGPMVTARDVLGEERFGELRAEMMELWEQDNEATDGSFRTRQQYLLSVIRL